MNTEVFDRAIKQLVDLDTYNWAKWAGITSFVSGTTLNTELAATNRRVDALLSIELHDGHCALHLEFQAGKDGRQVPRRLLDYSNAITAKYQLPVHTCVFLLITRADSPALSGEYCRRIAGQMPYLLFRYTVIRFWRIPLASLLISGSSVAAAGVLADIGDLSLPDVGTAIMRCIQSIPNRENQQEILGHAYTLAGMRFNPEQADSIFERQSSMLEQSSTVQHLLRRGRTEGRKEGIEEGRQEGRQEGIEEGREEGIALGLLSGERKQFMQTAQLFFWPSARDAQPTCKYCARSAASIVDIPATNSNIVG